MYKVLDIKNGIMEILIFFYKTIRPLQGFNKKHCKGLNILHEAQCSTNVSPPRKHAPPPP
jgi:hypothetical protein